MTNSRHKPGRFLFCFGRHPALVCVSAGIFEAGAGEFHADDGSSFSQRAKQPHELRGGAFRDPHEEITGLFTDYGRHDPGDPAELDVDAKDGRGIGKANVGELLGGGGRDVEMDEAAFIACGHYHAELERLRCGGDVR